MANKLSSKKSIVKTKNESAKPKIKQGRVKKKTFKAPKLDIPKVAYKKSEFFKVLSQQTAIDQKDIIKVLEAIQKVATLHLTKRGPGQFTYPGLFKMRLKTKPATNERAGRNPFNGQNMIIKAKPARSVVKISILKNFKDGLA